MKRKSTRVPGKLSVSQKSELVLQRKLHQNRSHFFYLNTKQIHFFFSQTNIVLKTKPILLGILDSFGDNFFTFLPFDYWYYIYLEAYPVPLRLFLIRTCKILMRLNTLFFFKVFSLKISLLCFYFPLNIHCVKSVRIRSYSGPHFPTFGQSISPYIVQMWGDMGQNNSYYWHFLGSDSYLLTAIVIPDVNPLMHNAPKWYKHLLHIFKACLTIFRPYVSVNNSMLTLHPVQELRSSLHVRYNFWCLIIT